MNKEQIPVWENIKRHLEDFLHDNRMCSCRDYDDEDMRRLDEEEVESEPDEDTVNWLRGER